MAPLSGMDEISMYFKRSPNKIRALVKDASFPAVKINGSWESDSQLIDKWRVWYILKQYNPDDTKVVFFSEFVGGVRDKKAV